MFHIHICCATKPMVNEFMNVLESFNLTQSVSGPTHQRGHTLDLVLSSGFDVANLSISDIAVSDHYLIEFESTLVRPAPLYVSFPICSNTDDLASFFNSACTDTLNQVAPLKPRKAKLASPWLNVTTRALRRVCRQAERKWKKDKLQISYDLLRDSLNRYQLAVKTSKTDYYAEIINKQAHIPKVLFKTINLILKPASHTIESSTEAL